MKSIAFIFPGQGSQYVGMGKGLYENFSVAKQIFEEADDALRQSIS
jgi:[acyl-carrier-protein] S-malonyltransferase